ncbi:MAG: DUF61 family protein [Candidatus Nezhaarchaeota archaeon]|nr:DUF61 family protein [Candidatus Nezhaarchaeota archaeon]
MLADIQGFERGFIDRVSRILAKEIEKINDHLPRESKTLKELLEMDEPKVLTKSGDELVMDKRELEMLASILPAQHHDKLRLPIIILRMIEMGDGVYMICGGDLEVQVINKVLGQGAVHCHDGKAFLYKPYVAALRGKLRTTTVIGFVPSME